MHRRRSILFFSVFVGVAFAFHGPLRVGAFSVIRAPFQVLSGIVHTLRLLPRLPRLADEHTVLQAEFRRQSLELAKTREALRHFIAAEALRDAGGSSRRLVASVIGRSPLPTQQTVLLNRGRRNGLRRDAILVDTAGVVGRVIEVHATTSLAMLITDPNSRTAGLIERSRESGMLVGQGLGVCRFVWLGAEADVQEGDRVVTAGLGKVFREKGLWLGTVISVSRNPEAGSATAIVRPAANLGRLEDVLCLVPSSS